MKKKSILLLIVAIAFMLSMIMHFTYAHAQVTNNDSLVAQYSKSSFAPTPINFEIAKKSDAVAVEHILQVVDKNLIASPSYYYYSRGGGGASSSFMDMKGELDYGLIFIKDNGALYLQSGACVTHLSSSAGAKLSQAVRGVIDQAERHYSPDGKNFYVQRVRGFKAKSKVFNSFPYSNANFGGGKLEIMNKEQYKRNQNNKNDIFELSNIVMDRTTIDPNSVKISYKDGLYKVSYQINLKDTHARDRATGLARTKLRKVANSDDLEFKVFKVYLEVEENGLIKKCCREESWTGTIKLPIGVRPQGTSQSSNCFYFSFNPQECSIKGRGIDTGWAK